MCRGRVGLVLADDAVGLPAAVLAQDRHRRAEMHFGRILRRLHNLRRRPARGPIAQVAVDLGQQRAVVDICAAACS